MKDKNPALRTITLILLGNIFLAALKWLAGAIGNSLALQADAANSTGDIFTVAVVFFAMRVAAKPEDKEHPYGHGKMENIAANFVGLLLFAFASIFLYRSILHIASKEVIRPEFLTFIAAAINFLVKEIMCQYAKRRSEQLRSPSLQAIAMDFRSDVLVSLALMIGIFTAVVKWGVVDDVASIGVCLLIFYMAVRMIYHSTHDLMDRLPDRKSIEKAILLAEGVSGVEEVHEIKGRWSGRDMLLDLKIEIDPQISVKDGHDIAHRVKDAIIAGMDEVKDVTVHVNPGRGKRGSSAGHQPEQP
jgi:cation diffusion facilitator family transporter